MYTLLKIFWGIFLKRCNMWEMNTQFFLSTVMDFRLFDFTIDNSISCCECIPYDRLVLIFPKVIFFSYAVFCFVVFLKFCFNLLTSEHWRTKDLHRKKHKLCEYRKIPDRIGNCCSHLLFGRILRRIFLNQAVWEEGMTLFVFWLRIFQLS